MSKLEVSIDDRKSSAVADSVSGNRRIKAPTAAQLLLPVWGYEYVRKFLEFSLPTLLAPGNVPAVAENLPCTFVILTSQEDEPYILQHPSFHQLSAICPIEIRVIDHLITGSNYSTTVTLAYTEAVRATGPNMLDTCFFFLVSDYIMSNGSLMHVLEHMQQGSSGVLVGNFQVALEDALPWLREQFDAVAGSAVFHPRDLLKWAFSHLHPTAVANTVNFIVNHNKHTNRLFWRVDGNTLVGRFFLMHMLCIRPERTDFMVGSSCDYSFVPEMCPSDNVSVITDSDDYLVIEMQPREHETKFLQSGPLKPRVLAKTLSEWTTARHRENSRYSVIFHSEEIPSNIKDTIAQADEFLAEVSQYISKHPKPHRGHPYWRGALAAHKDATGKQLSSDEWRIVLGLQDPVSERWVSDWLVEKIRFALFKKPPNVRLWHPRWPDYRPILRRLERTIKDGNQSLLMISDAPTIFTASLADGGERVVRLLRSQFLEIPAEFYDPFQGRFDLCLVEVGEAEMAQAGELIDRIAPLMKTGGEILVTVYNKRTADAKGFGASVGFHAARMMRPSSTPVEVHYVIATRIRLAILRTIFRLGHLARRNPYVGIPILLSAGPIVAVGSCLSNLASGGRTKDRWRLGQSATSFLMVLRVTANDAQQAYKYSKRRLLRQRLRRYHGIGTSVINRDSAPLVQALKSPDNLKPAAPSAGAASAESASIRQAIAQTRGATTNHPVEHTREPQYDRCLEVRDLVGLTPLGLMTNQVWYDDPRRLAILLSRYKFVAKMLNGRQDVGEVGCGDAFGSRVVLQSVEKVTVYDFDPTFIEDVRKRYCERWPIRAIQHDIILETLPQRHDAIYSLDVMEHVSSRDEHAYISNLRGSLTENGVLIVGMPSIESQAYASPSSKAGHVNCKSGAELKVLLERYFQNVFLFSMNDEVVHTGFYPMAHYLLAICCGKK
jgi:hypothetical protein